MTRQLPGVFVLLLVAASAWAAEADPAGPAAARREPLSSLSSIPHEIHKALQSREYADAVELIDELLRNGDKVPGDYLRYLKGRAQTELQQYEAALTTFQQIVKEHPQSRWAARAEFGEADVYARQRNYLKAGEIYRARAEQLLSDGRKDELAGIYLEFADRYFEGIPRKGPGSEKQPDYGLALTYYQEALKLNPSRELRQKIEAQIARSHQELGKLNEAIQAWQKFLDQYAGTDTPDEQRAPAERIVQARFQLGKAQLAAGQPAQARRTWHDFLTSEAAKEAGGDLVTEATYRIAHTYGIPTPGSAGDLELGVAALETFLEKFPQHKLAPRAEYEIAQAYIHLGRYAPAIDRLKSLIENAAYAKSDVLPEARKLLGQSYFAQRKFTEAIEAWKEFLEKHPTSSSWSDVQRLVIDAEYQTAEEQYQEQNYERARELWATFLNKYPLDARAPQILFRFGQMKYAAALDCQGDDEKEDADADLTEKCRTLFEESIGEWRQLLSKYPNTNEASQAAYMIGVTLEDRLGRLADALEAYKKVSGQYQAQSQTRISNLTAKQLQIATERKFRSGQTPEIRVETRNIERVTVKVYRIDMTDYFRKMHLARGVETLDISLIDPDVSFEHSPKDYEEYRLITSRVAVPLDGPGVTAVTVSSDTLEATTMVVVSDLDVIVKSSRNELFVFAENLRTQKPVPGASLLISDGETVFAEELTGEDGILQKSYEKLKTVNDLRVFAVHEGHMASTVTSLSGLDFAVGLSPKGYLYTDRPAYRPGQLVNLKGIVRWVSGDQFTFKPGEKYKLDVYDARGRVLYTHDVALGEFGTFAEHFTLPDTAPQGDYRIHLYQPGKEQSYETAFVVHETKLEPLQLDVSLDRTVFYRGETIEGTITLKYYYGTPLAGRPIRYRLADDRLHTAETDAKGQVNFSFPTEQFSESQTLQLWAEYPERSLSAGQMIHLATRGFDVAVSTLRDVYIAGETFDATVAVNDPSGKPVATELKLEVLKLLPITDRRARTKFLASGLQPEEPVSTHELKTGDDGKVRHTLRLEDGGRYVLRATGTDRFGHPVSGQHVVQISGDEDKVRLRILAEQHHYEVGDTAKVQLHWREEPALALVTYEGASILGYKLVELKEGANALEIPLAAKLAPNFVLAVDVMQSSAFHQARSEFRVARKLQIALKPEKKELTPGEDLNVDITVTDPQGKPVSTELSLALIQKNLLDVFGERQEAISEFFAGGYRKPSVRADASSTFRYLPTTRPISETLLAEEERQRILEMESAARESLAAGAGAEYGLWAREPRFDIPALGMLGGSRSGGNTDGDGLATAFQQLFEQRRYAEAEVVAQQLNELEPANPAAETMYWKARFARRLLSREKDIRLQKEDGQLGAMQAVDPASVPFKRAIEFPSDWSDLSGRGGSVRPESGAGEPFGYGGQFAGSRDLSSAQKQQIDAAERLARVRAREENGDGLLFPDGSVISSYSTTLSLIIDQTQTLQPNDYAFFGDLAKSDSTILGLNGRGELQVVNGLSVERLQELAKDGMRVLPNVAVSETGYWNPVVVTDKDGKAGITFRLPDRSTAWQLRSKGTTAEALTGQAEVEVVAKEDLFGELKTPLAFTEGDKANILVEIHNQVVETDKPINVTLKATIGDRSTELKKEIKSAGPGIEEIAFPVEITAGDRVQFELTVSSGELKNASEIAVPVQPFGVPVFATAGGTSSQSTIAFVEHDKQLPVEQPELAIVIGPSINRTLVDAVLGSEPALFQCGFVVPSSGIERAISDVLGGVAVLQTMRASKTADSPEAQAVAGRIQSSLAQLVSSQRDDGGWSWSGQPSADPDRFLSSRALWALAAAREAGFAVPQDTVDKAVAWLRTAFTQASESDREGQAILLHGLAAAGAGDFAHANRLYRERNNLSASGLLHVALALIELDRREMAEELLRLVKLSTDPKTAARQVNDPATGKLVPWMQSGIELRTLYLLALEETSPESETTAELAEWLIAARRGSRWSPEKANGPAIAALAEWFGRTRHADEKYTLAVYVNERLVEKLEIDPSTDATRRLEVPARLLTEGRQKINFDMEGRGTFSYSAVLGGFVPADKLKGTANEWRVTRIYEPDQRMLDGELIPRGFNILTGGFNSFRNPLTQLPLGDRGHVALHIHRGNVRGTQDEPLEYLIAIEPIPAGAMVLPESVTGAFERYEIAPGSITFYIGDRPNIGQIHYTLAGYLPGDYRAVPTLVRSFYQPERIAVSAIKPLNVLPRGEESNDEYKLTPVELYEFGKRYLAKGEYRKADEHLTNLFRNWRLQDNVYQEVVQMLFRTALATGQNDMTVNYFEIIKEKYPEIEIDFASILRVANAYRELGEYERSYLVFRATIESAFARESQIAGFLNGRGEFVRSVQVMERILHDYPAESYVATATYALAQEVYGKAAEAAQDKKLLDAKITRVDLIATAIDMLNHFLATWSRDPAADQAAFSLVNAHLDLEQYQQAIERAGEFAEWYPGSKLIDSFWYVIGFSQFALGNTDTALEMAKKVAEATHRHPQTGIEVASANKWQAIYIMGQIYHSLGRPQQAIEEYRRVDDRFPDATEAIQFFTRESISLPEVSTIRPGEPAKVPLSFRNIADVSVKVYRIDLMKFGLMQRNLDRITAINLAGIRPYHELTLDLGDGKDFRDREQPLELPLNDEGAYLVVARGGSHYASGLVLISPLELQVQEDAVSGRVRVTVKNAIADRYVSDVHAKVIGSENEQFISGETDLRGIFTADGLVGTASVIARSDKNRYAFYRGEQWLGQRPQPNAPQEAASEEQAPPPADAKGLLLDNVRGMNSMLQMEQRENYRGIINNDTQGVKAKSAY